MKLRQTGLTFITASILALAGCGDNGGNTGGSGGHAGSGGSGGTGGSLPDGSAGSGGSGGSDGGAMACDSPQNLPIPSGMTSATATGDNSTAPATLDPMTTGCRFGSDGGTGGEVAFRVTIPGTGNFQLTASTVDPNTTADTIVYIQTQCGAGQELGCNDDAAAGGTTASTATAAVTGGQTVFVIVDSYDSTSGGAFTLNVSIKPLKMMGDNCDVNGVTDVCATGLICTPPGGSTHTCQQDTAPTLASVELFTQGSGSNAVLVAFVSGSDPDGDMVGVAINAKDASGNSIGTGTLPLGLAPSISPFGSMAHFTSISSLGFGELPTGIADGSGNIVPIASIDFQLVDSLSMMSATINKTIATFKNLTQACSASVNAPDECLGELSCNTVCTAPAASATACAAATALTIGTAATGTLAATDPDHFEGSCFYQNGGPDKVYTVVVPAPGANQTANDLIVDTTTSAQFDNTMRDTYVYVRSTCADPSTEKGCNDDVSASSGEYRSKAEARDLAAGTYFVFVDSSFNGPGTAYSVKATLRPVLASGQTCDPAGVTNRCHGAACPMTGTAVCP